MSEQNAQRVTVSKAPTAGVRRQVAVFDHYAAAERAVDHLSDIGFPVEKVAIVGHDLTYVEQVTGRLTFPGAAWRGALTGALPGALIGWIFGLFSWIDPLIAGLLLALYGLAFGAVVGAVLGLLVHALQRGRRDFVAVSQVAPSRFEILVDEDVADEAARLITEMPTVFRGAGTPPPADGQARTQVREPS
ncbi:MAG: general stress protein [Pseudonocardia sediminis]